MTEPASGGCAGRSPARTLCGFVVAVLVLVTGCDAVFGVESTFGCTPKACEAAGGTCGASGRCELVCDGGPCVCPPNHACQIEVRTSSTVVDCSGVTDCVIRCLEGAAGNGYCFDTEIHCGTGPCSVGCTFAEFSCNELKLLCGTGPCTLSCAGNGSCQVASSVACGESSECTVECGENTCTSITVSCQQAQVCTATCPPDGNNTCNDATFACQRAALCDLDCGGRATCSTP